jgi:hypothetical protein
MVDKPSLGTDPRGGGTEHRRAPRGLPTGALSSPGIGDGLEVGVSRAGWGEDGRGGSQPAAGRESPASAGVARGQVDLGAALRLGLGGHGPGGPGGAVLRALAETGRNRKPRDRRQRRDGAPGPLQECAPPGSSGSRRLRGWDPGETPTPVLAQRWSQGWVTAGIRPRLEVSAGLVLGGAPAPASFPARPLPMYRWGCGWEHESQYLRGHPGAACGRRIPALEWERGTPGQEGAHAGDSLTRRTQEPGSPHLGTVRGCGAPRRTPREGA